MGFETLTKKIVFTVESPITKSKDINCRCLKSIIISQHGGDTWSEIILLEKFRVKITRRVVDLQFLKNCRHNKNPKSTLLVTN